jgi:hypothetical protein
LQTFNEKCRRNFAAIYMTKKIIQFLIVILVLNACTEQQAYKLSDYHVDYDGLMDTILPFVASLHDSIPSSQRFLEKNKAYMQVHKKERRYEWMNYTEKDGYSYFMISRLQPSIKKDKYIAICGKFKRDKGGHFDSASYEELFWTWKMKKDSLLIKSPTLFKTVVEGGDLSPYMPEKSAGFWIEFPSATVSYDKSTKSWEAKPSY